MENRPIELDELAHRLSRIAARPLIELGDALRVMSEELAAASSHARAGRQHAGTLEEVLDWTIAEAYAAGAHLALEAIAQALLATATAEAQS